MASNPLFQTRINSTTFLTAVLFISTAALSSRPLTKPIVILISSDGFRFGYQYKTNLPNIHRLIKNGTEAELGLIPVFPTLTFPNHYSIVTGLYPPHHGIVNNHFTDPKTGESFTKLSHDSKWWLGEPLWETVANNGLKASTYFWPGSEVHKGNWTCPPEYCQKFNDSVHFEDRVDTILNYFDLPADDIPVFIALYFENPDRQGHYFSPDHPNITNAVINIDKMIGRMINGLEQQRVFENVNIIMVGDHGMVGTCDTRIIYLQDLSQWIKIPESLIHSTSPLLAIKPLGNYSLPEVVQKMNDALRSVQNGEFLKIYLKEDLPSRLHYNDSERIPPIIGLLDEGFTVKTDRSYKKECGGDHGYDNKFFSMRTIFIGHGPRFGRGRKVASFENVQIYNLVTSILDLEGAPNNGSDGFADSVLLPSK